MHSVKAAKKVPQLLKPFKYRMSVPGSKSYLNRAILCAALANGKTVITQPNYCDDVVVLCKALGKLGVHIEQLDDAIIVHGKGGTFTNPKRILHMGNAGTATRFLLPHIPVGTSLTGDSYMQKRPLTDLVQALEQVGYTYSSLVSAKGSQKKSSKRNTICPPVKLASKQLAGDTLSISGSTSSQYISSLLMLAPTLPNGLTININGKLVSQPYIDMTLSVMKQFGIAVRNSNYKRFVVKPQQYTGTSYETPGDASSATYMWASAAITGSHITVENVAATSEQADAGLLSVLERMGCTVRSNKHSSTVIGPARLKPYAGKTLRVNMRHMPDAVMSLAMVAAIAEGTTVITNVHHLRVKETDRLDGLVKNLRKLGIKAQATHSQLIITGMGLTAFDYTSRSSGKPVTITTFDDHRFAMAFAVLGDKLGNIIIDTPGCVSKSYPNFWHDGKTFFNTVKGQNIVLTGMRGAGKSTLGKLWAKRYRMRFIDLDREIEKIIGVSIAEYVNQYGWKQFRQVEHEVTQQVAQRRNNIIATGGGTLMFPRNVALLREHYILFLYAPVRELQSRIRKDTRTEGQRPALHSSSRRNNSVAEVAAVWRKRKHNYFNIADTVYDSRYIS